MRLVFWSPGQLSDVLWKTHGNGKRYFGHDGFPDHRVCIIYICVLNDLMEILLWSPDHVWPNFSGSRDWLKVPQIWKFFAWERRSSNCLGKYLKCAKNTYQRIPVDSAHFWWDWAICKKPCSVATKIRWNPSLDQLNLSDRAQTLSVSVYHEFCK